MKWRLLLALLVVTGGSRALAASSVVSEHSGTIAVVVGRPQVTDRHRRGLESLRGYKEVVLVDAAGKLWSLSSISKDHAAYVNEMKTRVGETVSVLAEVEDCIDTNAGNTSEETSRLASASTRLLVHGEKLLQAEITDRNPSTGAETDGRGPKIGHPMLQFSHRKNRVTLVDVQFDGEKGPSEEDAAKALERAWWGIGEDNGGLPSTHGGASLAESYRQASPRLWISFANSCTVCSPS